MSNEHGDSGVERPPFSAHGLAQILESRANATDVLALTGQELENRVQVFLEAKIGQCREDRGWNLGEMRLSIEGDDVVIRGIPCYQYGVPEGEHYTGTGIVVLFERAGFEVLRERPPKRDGVSYDLPLRDAPLVIRVTLAEFNELTAGEAEWGDGGCGVVPKPGDSALTGRGDVDPAISDSVRSDVGLAVAAARRDPEPGSGMEGGGGNFGGVTLG